MPGTATKLEVTADNTSIYEGGSLSPISAADLINNEVAIRQLINEHNLIAIQLKNKEDEYNEIRSQTEFLKASPFLSILTLIINVIGTGILAIAANLMTNEAVRELVSTDENVKNSAINNWLFIAGISLIILSSASNILYPYARTFFNKKNSLTLCRKKTK